VRRLTDFDAVNRLAETPHVVSYSGQYSRPHRMDSAGTSCDKASSE